MTAVQTVGWLAYYGQTQMYRPLMDAFDKREGEIGLLWSVETGAMVIAMALAAGPLTRWSRVKVAVVGSLIFMVGNCSSAFLANLGTEFFYTGISNFDLLMATRIFVAIGGGITVAAAMAAAASAPHPERIFAIAMITFNLFASLESPLLPMAFIRYGATGGFLFLAGAVPLLLPFFFWLLPPKIQDKDKAEKENVWLSLRSAPNRKLALAAMAALFIYEIGQGGVNIVTGLIGENAGLDPTAVGWAFWGAQTWAFWLRSCRRGSETGTVSVGPLRSGSSSLWLQASGLRSATVGSNSPSPTPSGRRDTILSPPISSPRWHGWTI